MMYSLKSGQLSVVFYPQGTIRTMRHKSGQYNPSSAIYACQTRMSLLYSHMVAGHRSVPLILIPSRDLLMLVWRPFHVTERFHSDSFTINHYLSLQSSLGGEYSLLLMEHSPQDLRHTYSWLPGRIYEALSRKRQRSSPCSNSRER